MHTQTERDYLIEAYLADADEDFVRSLITDYVNSFSDERALDEYSEMAD